MKVLVATDGSDLATETAEAAARLLGGLDTKFLVVSVAMMPALTLVGGPGMPVAPRGAALDAELQEDNERAARAAATQVAERLGDHVPTIVVTGEAGEEICRVAAEAAADVVVVGARGIGPFRRAVLGSVSDHVVRHAPCPVLVVRHHDDA